MTPLPAACPTCGHEVLTHHQGLPSEHTHCASLGYELTCDCSTCKGTGRLAAPGTLQPLDVWELAQYIIDNTFFSTDSEHEQESFQKDLADAIMKYLELNNPAYPEAPNE